MKEKNKNDRIVRYLKDMIALSSFIEFHRHISPFHSFMQIFFIKGKLDIRRVYKVSEKMNRISF